MISKKQWDVLLRKKLELQATESQLAMDKKKYFDLGIIVRSSAQRIGKQKEWLLNQIK